MNDSRFYYSTLITSAIASLFITVGITSFVVGCSGSSSTDLTGDGGTNGGGGLAGLGGIGGGAQNGNKSNGGTSTPPSNAPATPGSTDAQCTMNTGGGAACDSCIAQSCCNEVKACKANNACMQAWNCVSGCAGDQECVVECLETNPMGRTDIQALAQCGNGMCSASCK